MVYIMDLGLFLCVMTLCQVTKFTSADETDDVEKSDVDHFILSSFSTNNHPQLKNEEKEYEAEKKQGDMADLFGTNQHYTYPETYKDLGRRFVVQYPYKELSNTNKDGEAETNFDNIAKDFLDKNFADNRLIPVKAPPELVLAVAEKAALLEAAISHNPSKEKLIEKEILRSGNYWNDVWQEDVDPNLLRTETDKVIQPVKVKIMPGSKLYKLVSSLKKISPRLIYVINKEF